MDNMIKFYLVVYYSNLWHYKNKVKKYICLLPNKTFKIDKRKSQTIWYNSIEEANEVKEVLFNLFCDSSTTSIDLVFEIEEIGINSTNDLLYKSASNFHKKYFRNPSTVVDIELISNKYACFYDYDNLSQDNYENIHLRRFIQILLEENNSWFAADLFDILKTFDNDKSIKYLGIVLNDNSKTIIDNIIHKFKKEILLLL